MPGGEPMRRWFARPATQQAGNGAGWLTEEKVLAAVASGEVKQSAVDDNVRRILRVMFTAGLFDTPHVGGGEVDTPEQRAVARRAATESMVLLKNEGGLLPLDAREDALRGGDRTRAPRSRARAAAAARWCGRSTPSRPSTASRRPRAPGCR